jgi:WD40 repeat protein
MGLPARLKMIVLKGYLPILVLVGGLGLGGCRHLSPPSIAPPDFTPSPSRLSVDSIVLTGHTDEITSLAWSPDAPLLATASKDSTVRLWTEAGAEVAILAGHTNWAVSLAWSPDGKWLASGSADGTARIWRADGAFVRSLDSGTGTVYGLAWSPDGKVLALGRVQGPSQNEVQLWDPSGQLLQTLPTDFSGGKFYNVAWSPDGQYLVGGAVDYKLWRADGTEVFHYKACANCTPAWALAWAPDGREWVIGNESGQILAFDTHGNRLASFQTYCCVSTLAWTSDSRLLAGGSGVWGPDGSKAFGLVGTTIYALAWSVDNSWLAAGLTDGTIRVWSASGQLTASLSGHKAAVTRLAWSPDGKLFASSGSQDDTVRLWQWP